LNSSDKNLSAKQDRAKVPPRLHCVLVAPQIPPNTGTLARTTLAIGAQLHLIRPLGFRIDEKTVRRAGLDYWKEADVKVHASWDAWRGADLVPDDRTWFFSKRGTRLYSDVEYQEGDALVFGSETKGLPPELLDTIPPDRLLRLPQLYEPVRSLNLAISASVAMFEALRQIGWHGEEWSSGLSDQEPDQDAGPQETTP
jgi:tRNA (cytidine/uridine-2'-O-)-methyltransferase